MVRQARIPNPLMPLRLFKSRNVAGANIVMAFLVAGMFAMFFLGALYLQRVLGYDPLEVGLAFLPSTLVMGTISLRYTERLNMRFGARATLIPGIVAIAAGLLLFARTPVDANYVTDVVPPVVLIGLGAGLSFPSLMTLAMSGATQSDAGTGVGPGQRHRAGGGRDRARGAGHPRQRPHRRSAGSTASRSPRR